MVSSTPVIAFYRYFIVYQSPVNPFGEFNYYYPLLIFQNLKDTHRNSRGSLIDWEIIRSRPIYLNNREIGFWPDCGNKKNSDYMSEYLPDFGKQILSWVDNESLIHLSHEQELNKYLQPIQVFKTTIEPSKPRWPLFVIFFFLSLKDFFLLFLKRICFNARPLGAVLKKLPCKFDQAEELIPYLKPGCKVAISDDSSGMK